MDFKNTIIIMTSNLGSQYILDDKDNAEQLINIELKNTFKPEFLNRIDEIIMFNSLSKDVVYSILDKIIKELEYRLSDKQIKVLLTEDAKKHVIDNAYDEHYGARPIKRFVSQNIETLIANNIISDNIKFNSTITVDIDNDQFILR